LSALHHLVHTAVRERLRKENLVARLQAPTTTLGNLIFSPTSPFRLQTDSTATHLPFSSPVGPAIRAAEEPRHESNPGQKQAADVSRSLVAFKPAEEQPPREEQLSELVKSERPQNGKPSLAPSINGAFNAIQLYDTYLVL